MGWGFSRDDVEGSFFSSYLDLGIFGVSPFESIDADGIGRLIRISVSNATTTGHDIDRSADAILAAAARVSAR